MESQSTPRRHYYFFPICCVDEKLCSEAKMHVKIMSYIIYRGKLVAMSGCTPAFHNIDLDLFCLLSLLHFYRSILLHFSAHRNHQHLSCYIVKRISGNTGPCRQSSLAHIHLQQLEELKKISQTLA